MLTCLKIETPPAVAVSGRAQTSGAAKARVPVWTKPTLLAYGDVRQLTMGPSVNPGESGTPGFMLS